MRYGRSMVNQHTRAMGTFLEGGEKTARLFFFFSFATFEYLALKERERENA